MEPQSRRSNRSTLLQSKENPQNQKGKKTKKEVGKPNDLPVAKEHKSMDSDEDDEEPQNEQGTSSTTHPFVPVLPLKQGPAASSQGPTASANSDDENSEYSDEYSARSQESGRTLLYPDLYILANDEHWTVTLETHRHAAAAGSFCHVTTETGEQQDINNLTTMPSVQRSASKKWPTIPAAHELNSQTELTIKPETCWNVAWQPVEKPQEQVPKCGLVHEEKRQPRKY